MPNFNIIHTLPGDENFFLFEQVPQQLYDSKLLPYLNKLELQHLNQCVVLLRDDVPVARAAFYVNSDLQYENASTSCVGCYECDDDQETSTKLINELKDLTIKNGCKWMIGPMEGSTWSNYRFSTHQNASNFFMEPHHHLYYNNQFLNARFEIIGNYVSSLDKTLPFNQESMNQMEQNYSNQGFIVRNLNLEDFENDLKKIGDFSINEFSSNFLFTPIKTNDFVEKYKPLKPFFDPEFIWIIENSDGEIQALLFAIKDFLDSKNETLIIKSVVRKKETSIKQVGVYLSQKVNQIARKKGFKKVIHAFMIDTNASKKISTEQAAKAYKSYALYGLNVNQQAS